MQCSSVLQSRINTDVWPFLLIKELGNDCEHLERSCGTFSCRDNVKAFIIIKHSLSSISLPDMSANGWSSLRMEFSISWYAEQIYSVLRTAGEELEQGCRIQDSSQDTRLTLHSSKRNEAEVPWHSPDPERFHSLMYKREILRREESMTPASLQAEADLENGKENLSPQHLEVRGGGSPFTNYKQKSQTQQKSRQLALTLSADITKMMGARNSPIGAEDIHSMIQATIDNESFHSDFVQQTGWSCTNSPSHPPQAVKSTKATYHRQPTVHEVQVLLNVENISLTLWMHFLLFESLHA